MDITITLNDGQLNIQAPFKMDTDEGKQAFGNFWQQFITQQIRRILDEIGDHEFSKIVEASDNVQLGALPASLELVIKLEAQPDEQDASQIHLVVKGVEVSPELDDAKFLFFLSYVDSAVKAMK
ncbi:hypothetical protein M3M38_05665 [Fructilactobacillus cliffordii]|uniref:hypothetical protein n=1 Tax=Fructilactobacillus cliffordii TaxID=2940299 RepID=UPI002092EBE8|nr:hypothetical protein [Fructilactobacillus cliffordii]USS86181.1 hypothetical protein M3M38_05665 [Fructilactobacillus cliffordii]